MLSWLICLPVFIYAQQVVSRSSVPMKFRVPYHNSDGRINNNNVVLREMAKDVVREPWQVKIQVTFKLSLIITRQEDITRLSIYFTNPVLSGDNKFRGFPVSDVLLPPNISMKLKWANRLDTTSFSEASITGRSLDKDDGLVGSFPIATFDPQVDTLIIRDAVLSYDSMAVLAFKERLELIHDYYASVLLLDSLDQMAADIQPDNPAVLPLNYLRIEEFNKVIARIEDRKFPATLLNGGFDPGRFIVKYNAMYRQSRTLTYNFIDELKKAGDILWNRNIDSLAGYFTGRVLSYVRRSKLMDQLQSRIYQEWLDHCFDKSSFPPGENVIGMLLLKMYPAARTDTVAGFVSGRIYASYRARAEQLMNQHQHAEAFSMMDHARRFIEKNPPNHGVVPDNDLLSNAAYGIYNAYTSIAQECIRNRQYNMADTYLAKADLYAREHTSLIGSDSLYLAVFSGLFFLRNSDCNMLLDQQKYAEALACYRGLEIKYTESDLVFVRKHLDDKEDQARKGIFRESVMRAGEALQHHQPDTAIYYYEQASQLRNESKGHGWASGKLDSLASDIASIRMEQLFNAGSFALEQRKYTLALSQLTEAGTLSEKYGIERDRTFDSVYRCAMKYCLIVQLSAAQKKIWANQFDSAYAALEKTKSTGFNYGLTADPDFSAALSRFEAKIRDQQCRNLRDSVSFQLIRADRSIALKNYLNATACLQQALAFCSLSGECRFSDKPIRDTLAKYISAANYQQKLADANAHSASGDYAQTVYELDENEQAYLRSRLDRVGIILEGVYDFISQRSNPYLTERAAVFYLGRGNSREAMRFLRLLRIQEYPVRSAASIQTQVGRALAMVDYAVNPKDAAMHLVEQYTSGDTWYDEFRKAYLDEWNRMAKKAQ